MQGAYDTVLTKAFFDPVYARKLIDIAEASQKSSVRATARRMAGLLGDNRGLVGFDINAKGDRLSPTELESAYKEGLLTDKEYQDRKGNNLSPQELESAHRDGLLTDQEYQQRKDEGV
jgi:hypothetical protein